MATYDVLTRKKKKKGGRGKWNMEAKNINPARMSDFVLLAFDKKIVCVCVDEKLMTFCWGLSPGATQGLAQNLYTLLKLWFLRSFSLYLFFLFISSAFAWDLTHIHKHFSS